MQYGRFAEVYDVLMKDVDHGAWAKHVSAFLPAGGSVLECACGTGEISILLAAMGFNVTASDISEDMLRIASEKQRSAGLAASRLRFIRMDMRHAALHRKADAVIACCDGVNYLTSRRDVISFFTSANTALKPGGMLLFDVSSRYKLEKVLGQNCFADMGEESPYIWQNCYDPESKLIRMELSFFKKTGSGLYERFDETHIQRAHSLRELGSWLAGCGFEYEVFAGYSDLPPGDDDERLFFAAKKTGEIN